MRVRVLGVEALGLGLVLVLLLALGDGVGALGFEVGFVFGLGWPAPGGCGLY